MNEDRHEKCRILLVNATDNRQADFDRSAFQGNWEWVDAPEGWKPEDGPPVDVDRIDLILVFARTYEEQQARRMCEQIRDMDQFHDTPVLVGISVYQMPLGNRVKEMSNAYYIFTPLKENDLIERARDMCGKMPAPLKEENE